MSFFQKPTLSVAQRDLQIIQERIAFHEHTLKTKPNKASETWLAIYKDRLHKAQSSLATNGSQVNSPSAGV